MMLLLEPSAAQKTALDAELTAQQTPGSCAFHQWLTPQSFAEDFTVSQEDAQQVAAWLTSQGFTVAPLPQSRSWIEFSGTAAQVEQAFHSTLNTYAATDRTLYTLTGPISVPKALAPVIHGLVSLDGIRTESLITKPEPVQADPSALAQSDSPNSAEALTPHVLSDMLHLPATGGAGQTIAIPSRSQISTADINAFRSTFGLPTNPPAQTSATEDNTQSGLASERASTELAASWAGAAAPNAHILIVPTPSTSATDGIDLALAQIIDNQLAHTVLVNYSACEASLGEVHRAFYAALYRQASAEGISIVSAAGDSGAAACHIASASSEITSGYAVNALASTPWNTAIGASALAGSATTLTAWSQSANAGGGGASALYQQPAWQTDLKVSQTGRLLPDLALPTGINTATSRGLAFCFNESSTADTCTLMRSGGSSAAAAIFAGISAVLAEKYGPQGNLAPRLYALSQQSGIFSDITQGDARLACTPGTSGCDTTGLDTTGRIGYSAASGYDLATGLGSVNAEALIQAWPQAATGTKPVTITLTASPTALTPGMPEAFTAVLAPAAGSTGNDNITGTVSFYDGTTLLGSATVNSYAATLSSITLDASKSHVITAVYSGDSTWAPVTSAPLSLVANLLPDTVTLVATPTAPGPGQSVTFTVTVAPTTTPAATYEQNPTGLVTFYNGTKSIGTATLAAALGNTSTASFTAALSAGSDVITAVYAGDSYYALGTSNAVTVSVEDFALVQSAPSGNLTIIQGQSGQASFVVSGLGGYNNQVQITCTPAPQDDMTCTTSPTQVTPTTTVTFTLQTYTKGGPSSSSSTSNSTTAHSGPTLFAKAAGGFALAFVLVLTPIGRKARLLRRTLALLVFLAALASAGIGCGGSSSASTNTGTPLGTTTIPIVATAYVNQAVVSHTVYLTVNVVPPQ
jgi:hypothetical protein